MADSWVTRLPASLRTAARGGSRGGCSSLVAMSASFHWMPWNSAMALPNWRRSLTYLTLASRAPRAMPRDKAAMEILPPSGGGNEAFAFFAQKIFGGDGAILEDEFAGVGGAEAELVFFFAGTEAGRAFF